MRKKKAAFSLSLVAIIELVIAVALLIITILVAASVYKMFFKHDDMGTINNFNLLTEKIKELLNDPSDYAYATLPYYINKDYMVQGFNIMSEDISVIYPSRVVENGIVKFSPDLYPTKKPNACSYQTCLCLCRHADNSDYVGVCNDTDSKNSNVKKCVIFTNADYITSNDGYYSFTDKTAFDNTYYQADMGIYLWLLTNNFFGANIPSLKDDYTIKDNSDIHYLSLNGDYFCFNYNPTETKEYPFATRNIYIEKLRYTDDAGKTTTRILIGLWNTTNITDRRNYYAAIYGKLSALEYEQLINQTKDNNLQIKYYRKLREIYPKYKIDSELLINVSNAYEKFYILIEPTDIEQNYPFKYQTMTEFYNNVKPQCFEEGCTEEFNKLVDYRLAVYDFDASAWYSAHMPTSAIGSELRANATTKFQNFTTTYSDINYIEPINQLFINTGLGYWRHSVKDYQVQLS